MRLIHEGKSFLFCFSSQYFGPMRLVCVLTKVSGRYSLLVDHGEAGDDGLNKNSAFMIFSSTIKKNWSADKFSRKWVISSSKFPPTKHSQAFTCEHQLKQTSGRVVTLRLHLSQHDTIHSQLSTSLISSNHPCQMIWKESGCLIMTVSWCKIIFLKGYFKPLTPSVAVSDDGRMHT